MTLKSVTATILQITGLITALTGLVKSLIDLIGLSTPHFLVKTAARIGGPHPPPPPPEISYSIFLIGPVLIALGLVCWKVAKRIKRGA